MSCVTCHVPHVTCPLLFRFYLGFLTKGWSLLVEVLLSMGPNPSSFLISWQPRLHPSVIENRVNIFVWVPDNCIIWPECPCSLGPLLTLAICAFILVLSSPSPRLYWPLQRCPGAEQELGRAPTGFSLWSRALARRPVTVASKAWSLTGVHCTPIALQRTGTSQLVQVDRPGYTQLVRQDPISSGFPEMAPEPELWQFLGQILVYWHFCGCW